MVERQNIFPEGLKARGQRPLLYAPVVAVVPGKLVFLSGILSRNSKGEIVGRGDMRAQIRQVFSNHRYRRLFRKYRRPDGVLRRDLSTSTAVEVRRLLHPDFRVEVEVAAVVRA